MTRGQQISRAAQAALLVFLAGTAIARADDAATGVAVLKRHVTAIKKGDVETLMADYADNAVAITPPGMVPSQPPPVTAPGVYIGKKNIRKIFEMLTDKDHIVGVRGMASHTETLADGTILLHWSQFPGTPQQLNGEDVFIIRDGKILMQDITVEAAKH
jgi:ketosteroid isomerase-like protein